MKGATILARFMSAAVRLLAPAFLTLLPWVVWTPVARWMESGLIPGGVWVWLMLPPALALEWWASRHVDRQPSGKGGMAVLMAAMIARMAVLCAGFFILVGRTATLLDTPDIFAPLVGLWPVVASMPYIESPILGGIGAAMLLALHILVTVRQRRLRMTTTLIAPGLFTLALFQFYYAFPTNPLHFHGLEPDRTVQQVYPFSGIGRDGRGSPFMAREIYVMPDEQTIVASYGVTFQFFHQGKDLNLARISLADRSVREHFGRVIRTFRSTCPGKLYAAPWVGSTLLEIDPVTFDISEIEFPSEIQGFPVEEIHGVLHDCERNRVVVANSRNPVVFIWNTQTRTIEKTLLGPDLAGVRMGGHAIPLAIDPVSHAVYLVTTGPNTVIGLSPDTMEPFRKLKSIEFPFDLNVSPDGKLIYVSSFLDGHVWGIDSSTMEITRTFKVPPHCRRVAVSADNRTLYVLSYLTGELLAFDADTGKRLSRRWIGPKPEGMFVSANYVWVSAATGIFRVPVSEMTRSP